MCDNKKSSIDLKEFNPSTPDIFGFKFQDSDMTPGTVVLLNKVCTDGDVVTLRAGHVHLVMKAGVDHFDPGETCEFVLTGMNEAVSKYWIQKLGFVLGFSQPNTLTQW